MTALLLTLMFALAPVQADTAVNRAEQIRLTEEIRSLSRRQIWQGVEDKYRSLEALDSDLGFEVYLSGAHSARALGLMTEAYERLQGAAKLQPTKEVLDWLWYIDTNYGWVELNGSGNRAIVLEAEVSPMDPAQRTAIEKSADMAFVQGAFTGVLPVGVYWFCGERFEVVAGERVSVLAAPKGDTRLGRYRR